MCVCNKKKSRARSLTLPPSLLAAHELVLIHTPPPFHLCARDFFSSLPKASAALLELTHEWHHAGPPQGGPLHPPSRIGGGRSSSGHTHLKGAGLGVVAASQLDHTAVAPGHGHLSDGPLQSGGGSLLDAASLGGSRLHQPPPSERVVHVCASPTESALAVVYGDGQLRWCKVKQPVGD
jgi:hypothetical protein